MSFKTFFATLAITTLPLTAQAGEPMHHDHSAMSTEIVDAEMAALFKKALPAAAFMQQQPDARPLKHQGTQDTGGHVHFDVVGVALYDPAKTTTFDICPHPERTHQVIHVAHKKWEYLVPIPGSPGYSYYKSVEPRTVTEIGPDGSVAPYHGHPVTAIQEWIDGGLANRQISKNALEAIIAEAERRGWKYDGS